MRSNEEGGSEVANLLLAGKEVERMPATGDRRIRLREVLAARTGRSKCHHAAERNPASGKFICYLTRDRKLIEHGLRSAEIR